MNRLPTVAEFSQFGKRRLNWKISQFGDFGSTSSRQAGPSAEVLGIQPWQDHSQRMAAVASARIGYPMALVTPREQSHEIHLLFDARSCLDFGSGQQTIWERIATISLALGLAMLGMGWRIRPTPLVELGWVKWPVCAKTEDWRRWRENLLAWDPAQGLDRGISAFPRQALAHPTVLIVSDAQEGKGPLDQVWPWVKRPVGLARVYDPWEQNPPAKTRMELWGPGGLGVESWSGATARKQIDSVWRARQSRWEKVTGGWLPSISHETTQPWETALEPWLSPTGAHHP